MSTEKKIANHQLRKVVPSSHSDVTENAQLTVVNQCPTTRHVTLLAVRDCFCIRKDALQQYLCLIFYNRHKKLLIECKIRGVVEEFSDIPCYKKSVSLQLPQTGH